MYSIGSSSDIENSPISEKIIDKLKMKQSSLILFMIHRQVLYLKIYQKEKLEQSMEKMNLLQASLAFDYCLKGTKYFEYFWNYERKIWSTKLTFF